MSPIALSLALVVLIAAAASAGADCAQGCLSCAPCTSLPLQSCSVPGEHGLAPSRAERSLPGASTSARVEASSFGSYASASIADSFQVSGLEGPVDLVARLRVTADVGFVPSSAAVFWRAELAEGGSSPAVFQRHPRFPPTISADTTLTVAITALPGQPFQVRQFIKVQLNGITDSRISGTLTFTGLPPDARVTSCGGYHQGAPVPVTPSSWGKVKLRYSLTRPRDAAANHTTSAIPTQNGACGSRAASAPLSPETR